MDSSPHPPSRRANDTENKTFQEHPNSSGNPKRLEAGADEEDPESTVRSESEEAAVTIVTWDGPDDPGNPKKSVR